MRYLLLVSVFITFAGQPRAAEPGAVAEKPAFVIVKDVPIEMLFSQYHMVVALDPLPVGAKGTLQLRIVNNSDTHFRIDEVDAASAKAELSAGEIKPKSSEVLTISLLTRRNGSTHVATSAIELVSKTDKSKTIHIVLRYPLAGLMVFTGKSHMEHIDPALDRQVVMIPFLFTAPVLARNVSFDFAPLNDGVAVDLIEDAGKSFARLTFDPALIPDDSLHLSITAHDRTLGLSDDFQMLLCRHQSVEVAPRTLQFQTVEDRLEAPCIVRYRRPIQDAESSAVSLPGGGDVGVMSLAASAGDMRMVVTAKRLGDGIYRIVLSAKEDELRKHFGNSKQPTIHWHIVAPDKAHSLASPYSVVPDFTARRQDKEVAP